jgi:uncharacterized membrane protein (DUF4010 family)
LQFRRPGALSHCAVSGFVDVDAITLSTAQLAAAQRLDAGTAWRIILVAVLANLAFKTGVVLFLGTAKLFLRILPVFGAGFVGGAAILLIWP